MRMSFNEPFEYDGIHWPGGDYDINPTIKNGRLVFLLKRVR